MVEITFLGGLVGGLIATVVMTVFMMALGDDSPPPTALFYSKYVGDEAPESYVPQGMILHIGYGSSAGIILALALPFAGFGDVALATAVGAGLVHLRLFQITSWYSKNRRARSSSKSGW